MTQQNSNHLTNEISLTSIKSLRLPANYGATLGVKKLLTNVAVGKPKKAIFFRTHKSIDMAHSFSQNSCEVTAPLLAPARSLFTTTFTGLLWVLVGGKQFPHILFLISS